MAKSNGTQGRVMVRFIVDRDGSLIEGKVVNGIGDGCDEEALRVLMNSPKWNPGIQKGLPARVVYMLPISFNLTQDSNLITNPARPKQSRFDPF